MRWKYFIILPLVVVLASLAHASLFLDNNDLHQALEAPKITIGDYTLDKDDLVAFYKARDFRYAWDPSHNGDTPTFDAFLDSVERIVTFHGLQPDTYALNLMRQLNKQPANENSLKLELLATDTLLHLAHDLHGDEIELDNLYPGWNFHRDPIDIPAEMANAVASNTVESFINHLAPQNQAYLSLAEALQRYLALAGKDGWLLLSQGKPLHLRDHNERVLELRKRLAQENFLTFDPLTTQNADLFDSQLEDAVKEYQRRNGSDITGIVDKRTLDSLNTPLLSRIDQIKANMERWRHMPDRFPPGRYAVVNIANMTLTITEDDKTVYEGPVVIGKVDRKTPFIQSKIRSMIINPSWHVPLKIARKDILPKLRKDPHYLEKLGFVISGSEDDPHGENIDWNSMPEREFNFRLRQSPGDLNSLGHIKFDFDNDFAVYMHGTPHQELFKKSERAFSSGCIRLRDPERIAEIITSVNPESWSASQIRDAVDAGKTRWVGIATPLPLYVLYWTVFDDAHGKTNFRKDIYNYDQFLIDTLKNPSL